MVVEPKYLNKATSNIHSQNKSKLIKTILGMFLQRPEKQLIKQDTNITLVL